MGIYIKTVKIRNQVGWQKPENKQFNDGTAIP